MKAKKKLLIILSLLSLCSANFSVAFAANNYWVGGAGDDISVAGNWNTSDPGGCTPGGGDAGAAPDLFDVAIFDADCDNDAYIDGSWTISALQVDNGYTGTIDTSPGITLDLTSFTMHGGTFNGTDAYIIFDADFNVANGSFQADTTTLEAKNYPDFNPGSNVLNNVKINTAYDVDIESDTVINGTFTITNVASLRSNIIRARGDIVNLDSGTGGTTVVIIDGTGAQTLSSNGGTGEFNNLTIDKSSGTLTVQDTLQMNYAGSFEYLAGDVDFGSSTLNLQTAQYNTLDINGNNLAVNNVNFVAGGTAGSVNFLSNLIVNGTTTITTVGSMNTGTLEIRGDIVNQDAGITGTATVLINGNGDQAMSAAGATGEYTNLTIDKSSGILTIDDTVKINYSGRFDYQAGNVVQNGSTFSIESAQYNTAVLNGNGLNFNNLSFVAGGTAGTINVVSDISVNGDLNIVSVSTVNTGNIELRGDIVNQDSALTGTATFIINGNGDQSLSANGSTGEFSNLIINKSAGTLTMADNIQIYYAGSFDYIAGTVNPASSTLTIESAQYNTATVNGNGLMVNNLDFVAGGTPGTVTMQSDLVVNGALTVTSAGSINSNNIELRGDLNATDSSYSGSTNFYFTGTGDQYISLTTAGAHNNPLYINKTSGSVILSSDLTLDAGSTNDLFIENGTLALNGNNLSATSDFEIHDNAGLNLDGDETVSSPTISTGSTVSYVGLSGPYTMQSWDYYNLEINGSGAIFNLPANTDVNGDLTIRAGTLDAGSYTIDLAGDWINNASFTSSTSTINLDGISQSVRGTTSFYNLSKVEGADDSTNETIIFENGKTFTVTGTLTLDGRDADDMISILSDKASTQFTIDPSAHSLDYLVVTDSSNSNGGILAPLSSTDNGNTNNWFPDDLVNGWSASAKITILHSQVNGDLTDFPVYIDLAHMPASFFTTVNGSGADIRVSNGNRLTQMPYELVSLDTSNGTGELWFKANQLFNSSNSDFYLWYGNPNGEALAETHLYGAQNVWSNGYVAVYHLNEDGNTSDNGYQDSTSNNNDGNGVSMLSTSDVAGQIGTAQDFDGSADHIVVPDSSSLQITSNITLSMWSYMDTQVNYSKGLSKPAGTGWSTPFADYAMSLSMNPTYPTTFMLYDSTFSEHEGSTSKTISTWYYNVDTYNGSLAKVYVNASEDHSSSTSGSITTSSQPLTIACRSSTSVSECFSGKLDEIHIANKARSPAWIKTEYDNQNNAANFYLINNGSAGINSYTWTGSSDATTWADQANWDINDGSAGDDGYPDDNGDAAFIASNSHSISTSTDYTLSSLTLNGDYSGTLTLGGKLNLETKTFATGNLYLYNGSLQTAQDTNGDISIAGDLLIDNGATLTMRRFSTSGNGAGQTLSANTITVNVGGRISAINQGFANTQGPGVGSGYYSSGGSHGGYAAVGNSGGGTFVTYGSYLAPSSLGSGGGSVSAAGGGAIQLRSTGLLINNGTITASAANSSYRYAGAAAGSVYIRAGDISGSGNISANGGTDTSTHGYPGSGGGGRVAVILTNGTSFSAYTGSMTAYGGAGARKGAAGTVYRETAVDGSGQGTLMINNNGNSAYGTAVTNVNNGETWNVYNLELNNGGILGVPLNSSIDIKADNISSDFDSYGDGIRVVNGSLSVTASTFTINGWTLYADTPVSYIADTTITNNGRISHYANSSTDAYRVNITINGDLTITSTGMVNVQGKGYNSISGPGVGGGYYSAGGSHGGLGALGNSAGGTRVVYGSVVAPTTLGSGGGSGGTSGGGAVQLNITGLFTHNGTISANANNAAYRHAEAAGGSVYVRAGDISGAGSITANGGVQNSGHSYPGGGSGGRISIVLTNGTSFSAFTGNLSAHGSNTSRDGAAGTVYQETAADGINGGVLTIKNFSGASQASTTYAEIDTSNASTLEVGSIIVNGTAIFKIGVDDTLSLLENGGTTIEIGSGSTIINQGSLLTYGTSFTVPGTFSSAESTSTVEFRGDVDSASDTITISDLGTEFYNLTVNGADANDSFSLGSNIDVNGDLNLTAGSFDAGSYIVDLAGDWINNASFTSSTSTINLDGVSQSLRGTTSFYNLSKIEGADDSTNETIIFENGKTFTVSNTLTLDGRDADDMISIFSDKRGTLFSVNPSAVTADYLVVTDSRNLALSTINPANSTNNGNTLNWFNGDELDDSGWSDYLSIKIPSSSVNGDLSNFPVYIDLADMPASFFSTVNGAGADVRITTNDKSLLAHELVDINTSNSSGELWFKANQLSSSEDNYFRIYFGNGDAIAHAENGDYGAQKVWTEAYLAAWHMNDDPASAGTVYDSTANNKDATSAGSMTNGDLVTGKLGKSIDFDGVDDYLNFSDITQAEPYSLSLWINTGATNDVIVGGADGQSDEYGVWTDGTDIYHREVDGTYNSVAHGGITGSWIYLSLSRSSGSVSFYKNGSLLAASSGFDTSGAFGRIAARGDGNSSYFYDGMVDEVHVSSQARSAAWIKTEYDNQNDPSSFYSLLTFNNLDWSNSHKITILHSQVNGDLTDFPVYVDLSNLPASFFSTVNGSGADIRMTNGNQMTEMPFELVDLDTANGTGELWFKADQLSNTSNTDFYLWYGNSSAGAYSRTDTYGSENVWTNNYTGVWHLNEDPNGDPAGAIKDSTSGADNGSPGGSMTSDDLISGKLGRAIQFDGIDDYINFGSYASQQTTYTIVAWASASDNSTIVHRGNSQHCKYNPSFKINSMSEAACGSSYNVGYSGSYYDDNWHMFVGIRNGNASITSYVDDSFIGSDAIGATTSHATSKFYMGATYHSSSPSYGSAKIDEVRISSVIRSLNWNSAEYANQNNPESFYLIDDQVPSNFNKTDWSNSHKLSIQHSQVNGDLSEFPVYVNLAHLPMSFFSTVNGSGADIRVTNGNQLTELPFELVSLDTNNASGELWFKADQISNTSNTDFYLWYGNSLATAYAEAATYGAQNVWSNGYVAVYHLGENGNTASDGYQDSSSYQHHGDGQSMTNDSDVEGRFGSAQDLDGSTEYIEVPHTSDLIPSNLTLSAWVKPEGTISAGDRIINKATTNDMGYSYSLASRYVFGSYPTFGVVSSLSNRADTTSALTIDQWHYLSGTYDATDIKIYMDGDISASSNKPGLSISGGNVLRLGRKGGSNSSYFEGLIDEVRISNKARSSAWIKTEYDNQSNTAEFYTVDDAAIFSPNTWSNSHKITVLHSQVNGDLTDFPVFVDLSNLPGSFFSTVNGSGADIRMTNGNQMTEMPFELVSLDTSNGTGELWFKADQLSNTSNTDFYLWYGNSTANAYAENDIYGAQNVWSNGYVAVYHLNEANNTSDNGYKDSSSNNNDANGSSMDQANLSGQMGRAADFDGSDDFIEVASPTALPTGAQNRTTSMWVKPDLSQNKSIIGMGTSSSASMWDVMMYDSKAGIHWHGNSVNGQFPNTTYTVGSLQYLSFVYDGTNLASYLDGALKDTSTRALTTGSGPLRIGTGIYGSYQYLNGSIDEVHIASKARSAAWTKTEYDNQNSPGSFYLIDNGMPGDFNQLDWTSSEKITVLHSQVNGDLTDFPVYLDLSHLPSRFFAGVDTNGADIRMTNGDQLTELAFEIVSLDTTNGAGELWFKADQLSNTSNTDFYLWYGNSSANAYAETASYGAQNVWSNAYVAVYHMNESPTGTVYDSTANSYDGISNGAMTSDDLIYGQLGKSIDFDGVDDYIDIGNGSSLYILGDKTIDLWAKPAATQNDHYPKLIWSPTNLPSGRANYMLQIDGFTQGDDYINARTSIASTNKTATSTTDVVDGNWHKMTMVHDTSDVYIYVAGVEENSIAAIGNSDVDMSLSTRIGGYSSSSHDFALSAIDEIHVSDEARSVAWIKTEYDNQNDARSFYLINDTKPGDFDSTKWSNSHKITIKSSEIDGDLTDFPVYVDLSDLPSSFFSTVNGSGADIRMTNGNQMTEMPFELVAINTSNASGELWFKADQVSSSTDTDFYIWYGNSNVSAYVEDEAYGAQNVWTNAYAAVYHMNESPTGTVYDSTANDNDASSAGSMTNGDLVTGKMGNSIAFDGSDDYLNAGNDSSLRITGNALTLSAWIKTSDTFSSLHYPGIITKRYHYGSSNTSYSLFLNNSLPGRLAAMSIETTGAATGSYTDSAVNDGNWQSITSTYNGSEAKIYVEGVVQADVDSITGNILDQNYPMYIGATNHSGTPHSYYMFTGLIDEVRVSSEARSVEWVAAEYSNQNDSGNFYLIDSAVPGADTTPWSNSQWTNRLKITINSNYVNGDLGDFPVYVDLNGMPASFFTVARSDGADIRVTQGDGLTLVPTELVEYDNGNTSGELWFKAPFLSSTANSDFYLYYGNANGRLLNGAHEYGAQNVWSNAYVAVYHMNQDPGTANELIKDSTSYRNHATDYGSMTNGDLVTGHLGKAIDFDGSNDYLASSSFSRGSNALNVSVWTYTHDYNGGDYAGSQYAFIANKRDNASDRQWQLNFRDSKMSQAVYQTSASIGTNGEDASQAINAWNYYSLSSNGTSGDAVNLYNNGSLVATDTLTGNINYSSREVVIAAPAWLGGSFWHDGLIDEVHIASKSRSKAWIKTEYDNQNSPSSFYTIASNGDSLSDTSNPKIEKLVPARYAEQVPLRHLLYITFSEDISAGTGNITIKKVSDDSTFEAIAVGSVTISGSTVTIDPSSDLQSNTDYYILIDSTAFKDSSNNNFAGISSKKTWRFKTVDSNPGGILDGFW